MKIHRIAADGNTVLTERTDALVFGPLRLQFWVCGVFEVHGGRITLWRDYFDMLDITKATLRGLAATVFPSLRPIAVVTDDTAPHPAEPLGVHRLLLRPALPDSMRDWVREDLAGKGATVRMMVRVFIPAFLIMVPFWFIPTTLDVHLSMTLPILIPFVFFSHALNKVWRRHMLRKHGLDPSLVDEL